MRKFLVALLILSVVGGVFAQEGDGKWNFGSLTGQIQLGTTFDLSDYTVTDPVYPPDYEKEPGVGGGAGRNNNYRLHADWTYTNGDWGIYLPLRINQNYFGTFADQDGWGGDYGKLDANNRKAAITYDPSSPLKVEIPFEFQFTRGADGAIPIQWGRVGIQATWGANVEKGGNGYLGYYFTGGFYDVLGGSGGNNWLSSSSSGTGNTRIAVGKSGGWYDFMDGDARLAVSYKEAVETKWFRVSEVVIDRAIGVPTIAQTKLTPTSNTTNATTYLTVAEIQAAINARVNGYWGGLTTYGYDWENIKGNDGIAYRFGVTDDLSVGIAFAGDAGRAMFNKSWNYATNDAFDYSYQTPVNRIIDFLTQPTVGVKFDNGTLGVSAMLMVQKSIYEKALVSAYNNATYITGLANSPFTTAQLVDLTNSYDVLFHIGGSYKVSEELKFNADLSGHFISAYNSGIAGINTDIKGRQVMNVGAEFHYDADDMWARGRLMILDFTNRYIIPGSADASTDVPGQVAVPFGVWFGYNIKKDNDKNTFNLLNNTRPFIADGTVTDIAYSGANPRQENWGNKSVNNVGNWSFADNGGAGFSAAIFAGSPDLVAKDPELANGDGMLVFFILAQVGYREVDITEYLKFNVNANFGLVVGGYAVTNYTALGGTAAVREKYNKVKLTVKPSIDWNIFSNGKIIFGYEFGKEDFARAPFTNKLDITFRWTL